MRWSFLLARISGIEVRIHFTFLLLPAFFAYQAWVTQGPAGAFNAVIYVCLIFLCVLLHEFGHAYAALAYGIRTPDITLLPIGGLARLERAPETPRQELLIALAGPIVNVVIAGVLYIALGRPPLYHASRWVPGNEQLLHLLLDVNVTLVLFNMLPAFPMDGGRVLRAFLAMRLSYARATELAARLGQALAFVMGFVGVFGLKGYLPHGNPMLILVAFFVYAAASDETSAAYFREFTQNLRLQDAMLTEFKSLPAEARLHQAVEIFLRSSQLEIPVVDPDGRPRGLLTRSGLRQALAQAGREARVGEHMIKNLPSAPFFMPFADAHQLMREEEAGAVAVVDRSGRLVGLLTEDNVEELSLLQSSLSRAQLQTVSLARG